MYINSVKCEFSLNDGLRVLSFNKKQTYLSEELDLNYRAALEIARMGELQVTVPDLTNGRSRTEPPVPLPRPSPRDCTGRYQKLLHTYKTLIRMVPPVQQVDQQQQQQEVGGDCSPLGMADPTHPEPGGYHLLQVRIVYSVSGVAAQAGGSGSASASAGTTLTGLVFRQPSPLGKLFEPQQPSHRHQRGFGTPSTPAAKDAAVCVYSASYSTGSLRDVDGVRCWLPTVDALDQRAVFDFSIVAPRHWRVACCGKKLSTFLLAHDAEGGPGGLPRDPLQERKITRFFTPNRIAAMSVGFYLGAVEMYKMPLYKLRSRMWVSLGLNDFISTKSSGGAGAGSGHDTDDEAASSSNNEEEENVVTEAGTGAGLGTKVYLRPLEASYYAAFKRTLPVRAVEPAPEPEAETPGRKRQRADSSGRSILAGAAAAAKAESVAREDAHEAGLSNETRPSDESQRRGVAQSQGKSKKWSRATKQRATVPGVQRSKLYERVVQHTTLGLDISLRLLHKFTGHRHDYDEVVMIFVADLGVDFVAYDAFVLIDAKFLHSEAEVQMETPAHLMLLQAYLYSWLKSALPVSSYDCEFIVHGAVGYLLNFYAEEVFGEEDGR